MVGGLVGDENGDVGGVGKDVDEDGGVGDEVRAELTRASLHSPDVSYCSVTQPATGGW